MPALFGVGFIPHISSAALAQHSLLPSFCSRYPAVTLTFHNVPWWRALDIMTPPTGTANSQRLGAPHVLAMTQVARRAQGHAQGEGCLGYLPPAHAWQTHTTGQWLGSCSDNARLVSYGLRLLLVPAGRATRGNLKGRLPW